MDYNSELLKKFQKELRLAAIIKQAQVDKIIPKKASKKYFNQYVTKHTDQCDYFS